MSREPLAHELRGTGDEVILTLNGGMMTYSSWAPVLDGFPPAYRLLGCDFRGQLRSPGAAHTRLIDNVPDVIRLLDALELDAVHVLGTSFGGEVGLLLAALHPARVRTLAAVTAVDRTPPGMPEGARELQAIARDVLAGGSTDPFHDAVVRDVYSETHRRDHAEELAVRGQRLGGLPEAWFRDLDGILTSIQDFDLTPWLAKIASPTLVVHAAADTVMPEERVRALAGAIPGAELRIHPSSGHVLVLEDPDWLARVYLDFLARHAARPSGAGPSAD